MFARKATRTGVQLPSPPAPKTSGLPRRNEVKAGHFNLPNAPKITAWQAIFLPIFFTKIKIKLPNLGGLVHYKNHNSHLFMNSASLAKIAYHLSILLACFTLGARPQQPVVLTPGENDLVVLNGCVISACNYLAAVKTQHGLEQNFWAKILLVRYNDHPAGHAYCVWETDGTIYGYDRNAGSFTIPVYTRDARSIAIVLAQELGKVLNEPLSVARAEFVDSTKTQVFKY